MNGETINCLGCQKQIKETEGSFCKNCLDEVEKMDEERRRREKEFNEPATNPSSSTSIKHKCSNCGRINDGSCKFYKQTESGTHGRKEWIVCESCSNAEEQGPTCSNCGGNKATNGMWCSQNCQWGREKKMCKNCISEHQQQVEEHRKNCPNVQNSPFSKNSAEIKLGSDYSTLKPSQQEGRQKTQASWTKKKNISFIHTNCETTFPYDESIENYLDARNKAKNELISHINKCAIGENKDQLQAWWNGVRNSKTRIIKTCEKCWGKVLWDKAITDVKQAQQQALSDFKFHQDKECHLSHNERTIAVYHSPNIGGNRHASLDNSLTDDGIWYQDNEGEVYQESQSKGFNWKHPGIIGGIFIGALVIVGLMVYFFTRNRNNKE